MTDKQQTTPPVTLGPVVCGTIVCSDIDLMIDIYTEYLGLSVVELGEVEEQQASAWGLEKLAGHRYALLGNQFGDNWLRFIEQPGCDYIKPISTLGWLSLEILVNDVYALAERFKDSPFEIIGDPKPLDLSDGIEAFQAIGPAGEMLYLTKIVHEVPPFDLPMARCDIDRLFIPVLLVPDIEASMALYSELSHSKPLAFDTKVTVINNALGRALDHRMPIASIQFKQQSFIEIDEVSELPHRPVTDCGLPSGIAIISFLVDNLNDITLPVHGRLTSLSKGLYNGRRSAMFQGTCGELIELIER